MHYSGTAGDHLVEVGADHFINRGICSGATDGGSSFWCHFGASAVAREVISATKMRDDFERLQERARHRRALGLFKRMRLGRGCAFHTTTCSSSHK